MEIAAHNIMLGKTDTAVVVGVESMTSDAPYLIPQARMGYRMGPGAIEDHMLHDGLIDELVPGQGLTAENVAERYGITREECDELALMSHTRAREAIDGGRFQREVVPVELPKKRGKNFVFDTDEHLIRDASMELMSAFSCLAFKRMACDCRQCIRHQRRRCRRHNVCGQSAANEDQAVDEAH